MYYIVFNPNTGLKLDEPGSRKPYYQSMSSAKAAVTRAIRSGFAKEGVWQITDSEDFSKNHIKMETKINLMTGTPFQQPVGTPRSCDPSTELYWTM